MGKAASSISSHRSQDMGRVASRKSPTERFIAKIKVDPTSGCWLWQAKLRDGYAAFRHGGWQSGHIWAYERFIGTVPHGLLCCHTCDVRSCVNPYHLFLGSNKDNTIDAMLKNRMKMRGKLNLTIDNVLLIRSLFKSGKSKRELAKQFAVSRETVHDIVTEKTYRFI